MSNDNVARAMLGVCLALIAVASRSSIADDSETKEGIGAEDAIAFCDRLQYLGIAARDSELHVWGCSPVKGEDGRIHLIGARFGPDFDDWKGNSHIVRYVADKPEGPFTFVEVVYRGRKDKPNRWDYKCICNPCIQKVDGRPAWLYAPSGACEKGRKYSDCHVFGILTDEEVMEQRRNATEDIQP